jgi:RNA polymerase sigma-70 factor (ECF subfamily)
MRKPPRVLLKTDEAALITRTQAGEAEAFTPLVEKYHSKLYTHIHRRVKDVEAAKDLTQQTWLKAYRGIKTFRGASVFSSWLYRIAENVCLDFFRKQNTQNELEPLHTVSERRIPQTHPCPSLALERQELRAQLQSCIETLTPIRKQVFRLYYGEDLSIKAIAALLKRSEGTIKTHLRHARLQLRELLTPYLQN